MSLFEYFKDLWSYGGLFVLVVVAKIFDVMINSLDVELGVNMADSMVFEKEIVFLDLKFVAYNFEIFQIW